MTMSDTSALAGSDMRRVAGPILAAGQYNRALPGEIPERDLGPSGALGRRPARKGRV